MSSIIFTAEEFLELIKNKNLDEFTEIVWDDIPKSLNERQRNIKSFEYQLGIIISSLTGGLCYAQMCEDFVEIVVYAIDDVNKYQIIEIFEELGFKCEFEDVPDDSFTNFVIFKFEIPLNVARAMVKLV